MGILNQAEIAAAGGAQASDMRRLRAAAKFERQYIAAQIANPADLAVASIQPAALASTAAQPTGLSVAANTGQYLCYSDELANAQTIYVGQGYKIRFVTDAPKFAIKTNGNGSAGSLPGAANLAAIVDGQYLSKTPFNPANANRYTYTLFDYSGAATPRKFRDVIIETGAGLEFDGVYVAATDTVYAPPRPEPKIMFIGDSYIGGSGAAYQGGTFVNLIGWRCGWDVWRDYASQGGTGYLKVNGAAPKFRDRLAAWFASSRAPEVVVIAGGINDVSGGFTPTQVQAEAVLLFAAIRAQYPTVPIVVLGVWPGTTGPSAAIIAMENGISAAVTQFADALTSFVPVCTASPVWIGGTGRSGATNASGNSDYYIGGVDGTDATHPTPGGHSYLADRVGRAVRAMWQTLAEAI